MWETFRQVHEVHYPCLCQARGNFVYCAMRNKVKPPKHSSYTGQPGGELELNSDKVGLLRFYFSTPSTKTLKEAARSFAPSANICLRSGREKRGRYPKSDNSVVGVDKRVTARCRRRMTEEDGRRDARGDKSLSNH